MAGKLEANDLVLHNPKEITASNISGGKRALDVVNSGAMSIPPYDAYNFTYNPDDTIATMTFELNTVVHTTLTYTYDAFQRVIKVERS